MKNFKSKQKTKNLKFQNQNKQYLMKTNRKIKTLEQVCNKYLKELTKGNKTSKNWVNYNIS